MSIFQLAQELREAAGRAEAVWTCDWDAMERPHPRLDAGHLKDGGFDDPTLAAYVAMCSPDRIRLLCDALVAALEVVRSADILCSTVGDHIRRKDFHCSSCVTARTNLDIALAAFDSIAGEQP